LESGEQNHALHLFVDRAKVFQMLGSGNTLALPTISLWSTAVLRLKKQSQPEVD